MTQLITWKWNDRDPESLMLDEQGRFVLGIGQDLDALTTRGAVAWLRKRNAHWIQQDGQLEWTEDGLSRFLSIIEQELP